MSIACIYVFWDAGWATVFASSYRQHPPGMDHALFVICNDGMVTSEKKNIFAGIPSLFFAGDNIGHDIGAFQQCARDVPCDMMVFFGGTAYVRGPGWLVRMADSFNRLGNNLYGTMANRGSPSLSPHIRTTGFWMNPKLLADYPWIVTRPEHRYPFEHGPDCLTAWVIRIGLKAIVVGWNHENSWPDWDIVNGFHNGDQSQVIVGDRMSRPPFYHCA